MNIGKLSISFYGPFVSLLDRVPVEIYAPRCIGHYSGIFTNDKEASLGRDQKEGMKKVYSVSESGIQPNVATIARSNPDILLRPPQNYTLTKNARLAWFCIQLPKPKNVVGIRPHDVRITGKEAPEDGKRATGLQLIFDYDMDQPFFRLKDSEDPNFVFETTMQDYCHRDAPAHFEITVRSVGPFLYDPDHEDAYACFEASAKLFESDNVALDWRMEFGLPHPTVKTGSDCGAAHLVRL